MVATLTGAAARVENDWRFSLLVYCAAFKLDEKCLHGETVGIGFPDKDWRDVFLCYFLDLYERRIGCW